MAKHAGSLPRTLTKEKISKKVAGEKERKKIIDFMLKTRPKTLGQKSADWMTKWVGSWTFLILLFVLMGFWIWVNIYVITFRFDPYPFILFNLVLSCLAAVQAPIILMSQNRQTERDRIRAEQDYRVDRKAEMEIKDMQLDLEMIKKMISELKK